MVVRCFKNTAHYTKKYSPNSANFELYLIPL